MRHQEFWSQITWRDIITAVAFGLVVLALIVLPSIQEARDEARQRRADMLFRETQRLIACTSARANIQQLRSDHWQNRALGIPTRFEVPELPEACKEVGGA